MKDQNKEIEMALLNQLCKVIDSSAMEGFHTRSGKLDPDYVENKEEVFKVGAGKPVDKNWGIDQEDLYEDDGEIGEDDDNPISKLRKLAKKKESSKEY